MVHGWVSLTDVVSVWWSPRLGELGAIVEAFDDIFQAITIILTTPKGSDMMRPTFGCDVLKYLDRPIEQARPRIIREVFAALAWEPRLLLKSVTADYNPEDMATMILTLFWTVAGGGQVDPQTTQFLLGGRT